MEAVYCGRMYQIGETRVLVKREAFPVSGIEKYPLGVYTLSGFILGFLPGRLTVEGVRGADPRYPDFDLDRLSEMVESYNGTAGAGKLARSIFPRMFPLPDGWRAVLAEESDTERFVTLMRIEGETRKASEICLKVERRENGGSEITVWANFPNTEVTLIPVKSYDVAAGLARALMLTASPEI